MFVINRSVYFYLLSLLGGLILCPSHMYARNVYNFEIGPNDILRNVSQFTAHHASTAVVQLDKFSWSDCGKPGVDIFTLTNLTLNPDPVHLPGTVTIGMDFVFREEAESPVKLEVEMYRRLGESWLKLPCVAGLGSCTYQDICIILDLINICPHQLVHAGIPCKCPYAKNTYHLSPTQFNIPIPILPSGSYKFKSVYTAAGKPGGCVETTVSFG